MSTTLSTLPTGPTVGGWHPADLANAVSAGRVRLAEGERHARAYRRAMLMVLVTRTADDKPLVRVYTAHGTRAHDDACLAALAWLGCARFEEVTPPRRKGQPVPAVRHFAPRGRRRRREEGNGAATDERV